MSGDNKVNILLVDDQPGKLLSYEVMLEGLGENLIKVSSAKDALEVLLKTEIGRLEEAAIKKRASRDAADRFFKS